MKYAEDYPVGTVYNLGSYKITAEDIEHFSR